MSQSETSAAAVEAALDRGELALADALLAALDTADRAGDLTLLGLHRRVEEGRGTRLAQLGHVQAFVARHPALAAHPRVLVERGLALRAHGAMPEARVELLRALDALDRGPDDAWTRATALAGIGLTHFAPLDAERARRSLTEARAVAARAGLLERVCHADLYLAHVEIEAGEVDRAAHAYRRAVATYEQLGDEAGVRHASYNLGMCLSDLGRDRSARRHLLRCKEIAERRSEGWWAAWATIILGELERKAGRAEAARAAWDRAEAAFRAVGGPTPTERAWLEVRRGELALDLGDLRLAEASARAIHAEGVEPTPRMYGRLILAIVRARRRPASAAVERTLAGIAVDAEAQALNEIAWRARSLAAAVAARRHAEQRLDGAPLDPRRLETARDHVRRAIATLEGTMGSMARAARRSYLCDHVRREDARELYRNEALLAAASAPLLTPSLAARSAWLRLLGAIAEMGAVEEPIDVLRRGLDAVIELSLVERAWIWLGGDTDLALGRDRAGRDLPSRAESADARVVAHGRASSARVLLDGVVDAELAELVDALVAVAGVLCDAATVRARWKEKSVRTEAEAEALATELARTEAALGAARTRLPLEPRETRRALLGKSAPMRELHVRLDRLQKTELPVLVTGESGTGKELVARIVHDESPRARGPFVAVNCGALSESLLESELFGHVRGAFSGAHRDAPGLFTVAHGGTLLLDEVGEMSLGMQTKLLRVLQEGEVRPVGGERARKVDVRVIAATHRALERMVEAGSFRQDLYYRLHVLPVHVPPLRVRGDDTLLLARALLAEVAPKKRLSPEAAAWLVAQPWPGNVRELRAVIESAAVLGEGDVLHQRDLVPRAPGRARVTAGLPERLDDLEAWAIARALERHGSRVAAARALGIGRATLYRKMTEYGLAR